MEMATSTSRTIRSLFTVLNNRPSLLENFYASGSAALWTKCNRLHVGQIYPNKLNMGPLSSGGITFRKLNHMEAVNIDSRCLHTSLRYSGIFEDRQTKALTVWSNVKELRASPLPALALGASGLVPFAAAPAFMMIQGIYCADLAFAQVAYGAVILSFLGGIRWGFTIPEENPVQPDWANLGYSVMPSLVAWCGLLLPNPFSLFTVMTGLTLAGYMDLAMYGYPPWFKGLRFLLSFVAILSLWTTFMCSLLLQDQKTETKA